MASLAEGTRIQGLFGGGPDWYSGVIKTAHRDGTYSIAYDDGEIIIYP
jgi:hypothetical protein